MEMQEDTTEYYTPQQLAQKLNMSLKFIEKHTQARRIPGQTKVGRMWRYNRIAVEKRLLSGNNFLLDRDNPQRGKAFYR
jgi:excisionase family DNA binding protein